MTDSDARTTSHDDHEQALRERYPLAAAWLAAQGITNTWEAPDDLADDAEEDDGDDEYDDAGEDAHRPDENQDDGDEDDENEDDGDEDAEDDDSFAAPTPEPARLAAPGWTPDRQRAFIEHLATGGCVSHAARAVGLTKQSAYQLRDRSPNSFFALAWDAAIQRSRRLLLDQATERAIAGQERPIFHRGQEVGTRTVHNDRLLMFLLGLKRAPVHPNCSDHEIAELWPLLLDHIDMVMPDTLTRERMEELTEES